jgi:hypothetical protein
VHDQLRANIDLLCSRLKNMQGIPVGQQKTAMKNWLRSWESLKHQVEEAGRSGEFEETINCIEGELKTVRTFIDI